MRRFILWPTTAAIAGFLAFVVFFHLAFAQRPIPQEGLIYVFSLMAAFFIGAFAAVFAAFYSLRDDFAFLRRDLERLQDLERLLAPPVSSTQFQADPGERP